ncbi:AIPR family protein [uncultured Roseobacter sp.]|uniref:AIPR family protein n=1 Tax=uncultured Roseobacter sp. TaxID=114847 RepID=UPI00260D35EC|nr:AIPR family protein [uncultured Roseobacter sp.]
MADWTSAYEAMKGDLNLDNDAIGVFAVNLKFNLDDFQATATEALTGGGDDKKCDLIYIDKELKLAVVAQCYMAKASKISAPSNKASDLNTAMTWLLNAPIESLPDAISGHADELRSALKEGEIDQIHVWYVHNCPSSKNVADELSTVEGTTKALLSGLLNSGQEVSIAAAEIGFDEISHLYKQAEQTIIVTDKFELLVKDALDIQQDDWSSVVTYVPGSWLNRLYSDFGTDLFSANLRGYLGSRESEANINNNIKNTAASEPKNFFVYNNGITAIVLDYELAKRTRAGRKLQITGISIVNGAQTTGSIGSLTDTVPDDLFVAVRFVKAKQNPIISNVVRFNNSQNKLQAADFRSTDPIQERLRAEFAGIPYAEYEGGRRGGASDAIKRSKNALPSYTVAQALAAFHGDPVNAYDKKSELWVNEARYRKIFTDRTTAKHIIFCYSLLDLINTTKSMLTKAGRADADSQTELDKKKLSFLNQKGANYLLVYVISQCLEGILGRPIPNKFDLHFKKNLSPEGAMANWKPIVDIILSLSIQLDDAFSKNRISSEGVEGTVPKFVGVIDSLKDAYSEKFTAFAAEL